ncbi:Uncharacterised protein at_DN0687 [Pycnogonum litorale]
MFRFVFNNPKIHIKDIQLLSRYNSLTLLVSIYGLIALRLIYNRCISQSTQFLTRTILNEQNLSGVISQSGHVAGFLATDNSDVITNIKHTNSTNLNFYLITQIESPEDPSPQILSE